MQWNGIKIPIVILALLVGLGALWGGRWLFNSYSYERPLAELLGENSDIVSYDIKDVGTVLEVEVKLREVDNLQSTYNSLLQSVQESVGNRKSIKITVEDDPDPLLEGLGKDARLAAYEALDRGNYIDMGKYIEQSAAGEGARASVFLDQDRLFIQIEHQDKYLYDIIPRTKRTGSVSGNTIEGGRPT